MKGNWALTYGWWKARFFIFLDVINLYSLWKEIAFAMTCCSLTVDDRVSRAASLNEVWFQSLSGIDCVLYALLTTVRRPPLMDARSRSHVSNTHGANSRPPPTSIRPTQSLEFSINFILLRTRNKTWVRKCTSVRLVAICGYFFKASSSSLEERKLYADRIWLEYTHIYVYILYIYIYL